MPRSQVSFSQVFPTKTLYKFVISPLTSNFLYFIAVNMLAEDGRCEHVDMSVWTCGQPTRDRSSVELMINTPLQKDLHSSGNMKCNVRIISVRTKTLLDLRSPAVYTFLAYSSNS
jgi:hypothetical protein